MPKGIRKSKQQADLLVPPGATHFPTLDGSQGDPLPAGVAVRSNQGVQIEFAFDGKRCTETIPGLPTVEAVMAAARVRDSVLVSIEQRSFSYEASFPNSRRVRRAAKQKAATTAAEEAVAGTTMGELFEAFLERFRMNYPGGQNTYDTHAGAIRSHLAKQFGHLKPIQVTTDLIVSFRERLRTSDKLSDSRVGNLLTPLRGAIDLALERDLISRNPFDKVSPTKPKKQRTVSLGPDGLPNFEEPLPLHTDREYAAAARAADPFDADERQRIVQTLPGQVRNLVCFAFWAGLRTGELIALRWCDVDWDNKRVCVRISFSKRTFTPTKGRRLRWVPLLPPALQALERQKEHTGSARRWVFNNPVTHDRWSSSERLRRRWVRALKAAGVRYRYQYQTRHTYASVRMSAGESAADVAAAMGHLDVRLVSIVYARFVPPDSREPGARTIAAYSEEWKRLASLMEQNDDVVTPEDLADVSAPDEDETDDVDPMDRLDRN